MPNLSYEELRQKIAALNPSHAEVESLFREMFPVGGQIGWGSNGSPTTDFAGVKPVAVTEDYTAGPDEFISVTCSTVDITITLPSAADNQGLSIYIHKVDATAFKVLTSVKDLAFQNSTMHLISDGADWIIS